MTALQELSEDSRQNLSQEKKTTHALVISGMQSRQKVLVDALTVAGWQTSSFLSPQEALEALKTENFGAIFCDEQLRGGSSAGLLVWVRRLSPDISFYVFTHHYDPNRYRLSGEPTGVLHFPPILGQLPKSSDIDVKATLTTSDTPMSGNTADISLADLIEILSLSKQKVVIELGAKGLVTVNKDKLEHAICFSNTPPTTGLQALAQLIALEDCDFRVAEYRSPKRPTINLYTVTAMTEAARLADEGARFRTMITGIKNACPTLEEITIGYRTSASPSEGWGAEPDNLFGTAQRLLELNRESLGDKVVDMFMETSGNAYVIITFGEKTVIAASGPAHIKGKLYRAIHEAIKLLNKKS